MCLLPEDGRLRLWHPLQGAPSEPTPTATPTPDVSSPWLQFAHTPREERQPCRDFVLGRCPRGDACWLAHPRPPPLFGDGHHHLVLTTPRSKTRRVAAAAAALGDVLPTGAVRGDSANKGADCAVFVSCPVPGDAAAQLAACSELQHSVTRALWVSRVTAGNTAAAEVCRRYLPDGCHVARLRVWPPWAADGMQAAMAAAGVTLRSASSGEVTHIIDAVLATERWHTHVWEPSDAPGLLHWSGRPAFDAESTRTRASRAWFKMDELLRTRAFSLHAGGICVDVGAAPGGWSARLSAELVRLEAGCAAAVGHVLAIDPGALTLDPMPTNVTHLQLTAERAMAALQEALAHRIGEQQPRAVDWVVCDANCTPALAAQLALPFACPATRGVVITMKRFAPSHVQHEADVAECTAAVGTAGFAAQSVHHLLSNGRDERTLVATRVEETSGPC